MKGRPALAELHDHVDVIIIGGGINGAGILRAAADSGLKLLLLEQDDFASGTSSASSKLIHGGLRYLRTGQWRLTLESVRERRALLQQAPHRVKVQEFMMPIYRGMRPGKWAMRIGLWLYDLMAGQARSRWLDRRATLACEPQLRSEGLLGAMQYQDAQTDDARLVLDLLFEAQRIGASMQRVVARNYTRVERLLESDGRVRGVVVLDRPTGELREITADLVIQATGAATGLAAGAPVLRPLRGSHFVFPASRLQVGRAVSWLHPADRRPVFAFPWCGATLYGTTDLDHGDESVQDARMSRAEADYLLTGLAHQFPELKLTADDAVSSYAGVRPVVAGGKQDPSAESRESALWSRPGLVGIAGGKLTTFRVTAKEVLREAARQLPRLKPQPVPAMFAKAPDDELLPDDAALWHGYRLSDLRRAARSEQVVHLDDLLLRRTRIGLVEARGGQDLLTQLFPVCCEELGWDEKRWDGEVSRYRDLWQRRHAPQAPA